MGESTVITAVITATATIIAAVIGAKAAREKEKRAYEELRGELQRHTAGEKPIKHYLLFW